MGITQALSGAHRAFKPRNSESRIVTSGGRLRAHHHQGFHTPGRQRPMIRRRTSAGKVNTFMPRQPSLALRSQVLRRKVWMLEAKKQGLRPARASKLTSILLKLKKKVKYMNRQQYRGEFRDSLRRVFQSKCYSCLNGLLNLLPRYSQPSLISVFLEILETISWSLSEMIFSDTAR